MTIQTDPNLRVAITIKDQIGTDTWLAVSAREGKWWTDDNGDVIFAFRFGGRYGLAKWCEITYRRGSDDYAVTAYKIHRNGCKVTLKIADRYEYSGYDTANYYGVHAGLLSFTVRHFNQMGELA